VGRKRTSKDKDRSRSLGRDDSENIKEELEANSADLKLSESGDYGSDLDLSGDESSTNQQLFRIERKIQQPDLSKRERRLLQNRKSALKCRLKKQNELDKMKRQVDKLMQENRELKEKVSIYKI
jgi:hypothetical protein